MPDLAGDAIAVYSAGTKPAKDLNPQAVKSLTELGIDVTGEYPKPVTDEVLDTVDAGWKIRLAVPASRHRQALRPSVVPESRPWRYRAQIPVAVAPRFRPYTEYCALHSSRASALTIKACSRMAQTCSGFRRKPGAGPPHPHPGG
ncbi:hypothetical protein QF038_000893 [Pseudarthrobacter sp. W1I19]|nr:hypothetical protein [Pseudarthrobacter sp. W1I19]